MAIVARVKAAVLEDGQYMLPPPTQGTVRGEVHLFVDSNPPTHSGKILVIGDDIGPTSGPTASRYGQAVNTGDVQKFDTDIQAELARKGFTLAYFADPTKKFVTRFVLPAALLDGYTG